MTKPEQFRKWALGYSGCNGGDVGSPDRPTVWVCGIEWGGGHCPSSLSTHMQANVENPPDGYEKGDESESLRPGFNIGVVKLLSVISGGKTSDYKQFSENARPFFKGSKGYFKTNLYPIGFKNMSRSNWSEGFGMITGFQKPKDYLDWCEENRFLQMTKWAHRHKPKAIICFGKLRDRFGRAFSVDSSTWTEESIENRKISWALTSGTLIFVAPFPRAIRDSTLQKIGERISQLLIRQATH